MKTLLRVRNFFSAHLPGTSSRRRRHSIMKVRSLMDCMPNEILSHIFQLLLLDPEQNPVFSFSITQVCARWRDLAISSPGLWTRIAFTFPVSNEQFSRAACALERSQNHPLGILLDCRDPEWDWDEEGHSFQWSGMQDIVERLLPHASRWRTLVVLTDTWLPIYALLRLTKNLDALPQLEVVSLSRCNAFFAAMGQVFQPMALAEPVPLFGGAVVEKLRELSLVGVHVDWGRTAAFHGLTKLELKYHAHNVLPTLDEFAAIIEKCPQLENLSILGWGPRLDATPPSSVTSIVLSSLKKFSFGFVDMHYGTRFLSLLQLPSLKELYLEDVARTVSPLEPQDSTMLLNWLVTSQPSARSSFASPDGLPVNPIPLQSVRTLELQSIHASEDAFRSFFRCFSSITKLSLVDVSNEAITALEPYTMDYTPRRHSIGSPGASSVVTSVGCVCPALQELYCQDADAEDLVEMVSARAVIGTVPPLRSVMLEYMRSGKPAHDSEQYRRLANSGINVLGSPGSEGDDSE